MAGRGGQSGCDSLEENPKKSHLAIQGGEVTSIYRSKENLRPNCTRNRNSPPESGRKSVHNRGTVPVASPHRGSGR